MSATRVALVTGGSRRIGRAVVLALHSSGYKVCIHYNTSCQDAAVLRDELNASRHDSAMVVEGSLCANLAQPVGSNTLYGRCKAIIDACYAHWGRCDVLINNASAYYPTPLVESRNSAKSEEEVEREVSDLFGSNAIAPYYLIRAFASNLTIQRETGEKENRVKNDCNWCVVNMVDAMANQPLHNFAVYTMAKGALESLTKAAALELAPYHIRVNGVGPGLSCLPVSMPAEEQAVYRAKVPLGQREATGDEIAQTVLFLCSDASKYTTGALVNVDGAWSLTRA